MCRNFFKQNRSRPVRSLTQALAQMLCKLKATSLGVLKKSKKKKMMPKTPKTKRRKKKKINATKLKRLSHRPQKLCQTSLF